MVGRSELGFRRRGTPGSNSGCDPSGGRSQRSTGPGTSMHESTLNALITARLAGLCHVSVIVALRSFSRASDRTVGNPGSSQAAIVIFANEADASGGKRVTMNETCR